MSWQVPASVIVGHEWDVAIVGCGPAGAVAALQLAAAGVAVVALDRHEFPRDKVCGDALIPDAQRVLQRIGLVDRVRARSHVASRLRVFSPSAIEVPLKVTTYVIRRHILDEILAEGAVEAGARVARGNVTAIELQSSRVVLTLEDGGAITARVAVVATGADLRLLNGFAAPLVPTGVAIRRYVRATTHIDDLVIAFDRHIPGGYAWIFPLGGGEFNVGCGVSQIGVRRVDLSRELDRFLRRSHVAREFLGTIRSATPIAGAAIRAGLRGAAVRYAPNIVVAGEALGATFPLSGEGIGKAMETADRAAAAIVESLATGDLARLAAYDEYVKGLAPLYRGYAAAQRWLARPWLNDLTAALVRGSPHALSQLEGILEENVDPQRVFSLRGVWNMLMR